MFNDERINQACGRIYSGGILLAVLYTALFAASRILFLGGFRLSQFLNEAAILVTGGAILLIGLLRWGVSPDERGAFEKHNYYLAAGKVFVIAALAGYAVSIPLRMRITGDSPVNELILHLLALGCAYFFYTFKRHEISLNYTFIDTPNRAYYGRVFLNIAKLAGILLLPFSAAAMLDLWLHQSFLYFLAILLGYVTSVTGLGLDYLLLSALEKMNYDEESPVPKKRGALKRGTLVAFILAVGAELVTAVLTIVYYVVLTRPMTEMGRVVAAFNTALMRWSYPTLVITALALCLLMEQTSHSKRVRIGVCGALTIQSLELAIRAPRSSIIYFLERINSEPSAIVRYADAQSTWSLVAWLILIGFTCLWIHGLIRDCGATRALWLTVALTVICRAVGIFLGAQSVMVAFAVVVHLGGVIASALRVMMLRLPPKGRQLDTP